jgi:hypothetical protein
MIDLRRETRWRDVAGLRFVIAAQIQFDTTVNATKKNLGLQLRTIAVLCCRE